MDTLLGFFNIHKELAILISLILNIVIAILGIVPSIFLTGANIVFFGAFKGFIISLLGESIGAIISFILYRKGFKKYFKNFQKSKILNKIIESNGITAGLLIFQARLIPFIPSGFVTLSASISNVSSSIFFISSLLGKIPSIALEVLLSYEFINLNKNWINLSLTSVVILSIFFTFNRNKKINKNL